ncbi:MAG TPA: hypothetical protein VJQ52_23650 [Steroidobacteraceae bacterium]|nr:hypothetical protein [Steroidobacteraceae bacterium]
MSAATPSHHSPLVIGVSGHRDLHAGGVSQLTRQVDAFLADLKRRLPDTELRVMTGMAQGADLLVASAACKAGWKVDAVLPLPLERYVEDFDADAAATLRTLLADPAVTCTVLPPPPGADLNARHGAGRDVFYANLTQALTDKCNLLVALWDGNGSNRAGGTADTVLRYLGARTHVGHDQIAVEFQPATAEAAWGPHFVYWIPAPRGNGSPSPAGAAGYLSGIGENLLAMHGGVVPHALEQMFVELNTYNREFERLRAKGAFPRFDSLMPTLGPVDPGEDSEALQRIDQEYAKSDALAVYYQRHSDRLFRWFSYTASVMALLFLIYAKLWANAVLLSMYLSVLLLSVLLFHRLRSYQWFSKHLVYRVLAETMRIKFFLRAAGADRLVSATELINLTGIDQFSGFSWISNLLKNVESLDVRGVNSDATSRARLASVHRHWIVGQQEYFRRRVRLLEREHRRLESLKNVMFYAIVGFALILLVFAVPLHERLLGSVTWKDVLMFLMGLLPVWLGIWELYQNKMAMRELLWQYRNQLGHFTIAELQLSRHTTAERSQEILAQVGKEALMESYLWTIHRFHREYEPPTAT